MSTPYDQDNDDPLAPARGVIYGAFLGTLIWALIWAVIVAGCGALLSLITFTIWRAMP